MYLGPDDTGDTLKGRRAEIESLLEEGSAEAEHFAERV